jgi:hypothetical protein
LLFRKIHIFVFVFNSLRSEKGSYQNKTIKTGLDFLMANLKINQLYERILFFLVAALVVFVRLRYADMAMERDEGEYAYAGSQILRGGFPFKDFYNMKLPGVYYCYALILAVLGKSVAAIRYAVLGLNLLSAAFMIKLGTRWMNAKAGWLAGAFYLFFSMADPLQGIIANCEHFVVFFFLLTLWTLSKERFFLVGISAALTIFMKQQGVILLCFAFIYLAYLLVLNRKQGVFIKKVALLSLGFFLPFGIFLAALWYKNTFAAFKYFAIDYAKAYIGIEKPHIDFSTVQAFLNENTGFYLAGKVALAMAIVVGFLIKKIDFKTALNPWFLVVFLAFSYAAVLPGWYYRAHYHQYLIPAVAFLMAFGWSFYESLSEKWTFKALYMGLLLWCFGDAIERQQLFLFQFTPEQLCSKMYGDERFHEFRTIGNIIKKTSQKTDTIGLMGPEPELFFYADRVSASGYMYSYPFVEKQRYSMDMAFQYKKEIITCKPKWFIDCFRWYTWAWFDNRIPLEDTDNFIKRNYFLRGALYEDKKIEWQIDSVDTKRKPRAIIYERRDSGQTTPTPLVFK